MPSPLQIERSYELAEQALQSMRDSGIEANAENFQLWFSHHSGANIALSQSIRGFEHSNVQINQDKCRELHEKFFTPQRQSADIEDAADRVGSLVERLGEQVSGANQHTEDYQTSLTEMGEEIEQDIPASALIRVIADLKQRTQEMQERTSNLQTELRRNTVEIEGLRDDLASSRLAANTDQLTGVGNRKVYDDTIHKVANAARESGAPLSIMVADIDHFKQFNDRFGHKIGDIVLKLVAKKMQAGIKGRDTLVRYGGEEFVVILPMTNLKNAELLADQLRSQVAGNRVVLKGQNRDLGHITLSLGVAEFDLDEDVETLFERADAALYEAKNSGRNRVVAANSAEKTPPNLVAVG